MKSAENAPAVSPVPTLGSGPAIHPGMPCQLAGIRPDGPAAARMHMTRPQATRPPRARAPPSRGASERGRAIEGVAIAPSLPGSDQAFLTKPGFCAPKALVESDLRLIAEHPASLLDRVGAAPREVRHRVRAHLVLLAAQPCGSVDAVRDRGESGARQHARALLAEHRVVAAEELLVRDPAA